MTPLQIVLYGLIGGLLAFTVIIIALALLFLRWLRTATPDPNDRPRRIPQAVRQYSNGTAEREQAP